MSRVRVQDLRTARYCLKGARAWFARHGFDWAELVRDGIAAERLQATGDALVHAAVKAALDRERQQAKDGRGRKTQTVGYRYALGAHLALCHGPVDVIREILVDDKIAWSATTGSAPAGGTADAPARIGAVAEMAATPAQTGETGASITLPGTLAGVR